MEKKREKEIDAVIGSGNVFKDLGYPNPEEALAKAELARQINKIVKSRKLTQQQTAEILGIDQPRVSDIMRGKLSRYSIDRLMRFLRMLGRDIEIRVKKHTNKKQDTWLHVVEVPSSSRRQAVA